MVSEVIQTLAPEAALLVTACVVMVVGLSKSLEMRRLTMMLSVLGLLVAAALAARSPEAASPLPMMAGFGKVMIALIGVLIVLLLGGVVDQAVEKRAAETGKFDPLNSCRGEFMALALLSLAGAMLCAGAMDLIWLFLALELTSLPTYVMVALSTSRNRSLEAAVKYFFLGALGAATFLYGFALMYGSVGSTNLIVIRDAVAAGMADGGGLDPMMIAGLTLSIVGVGFKIAAVPMHFYTPDVYQGASSSVSAMLAFVPKAAGIMTIMLLVSVVGWRAGEMGESLAEPVRTLLWVMAAMTMTVGNTLAVLQSSVKRMLAYSSIAHSGYMLVGVIAGPVGGEDGGLTGLGAVLFYMASYGVMNLGAFAALACLRRPAEDGEELEEADDIEDVRGLWRTRPVLAAMLAASAFGLLGLPLTLGFFAKLPLFTAGMSAGEVPLVVVLGVNSAIAAFYYLRLVYVPLLAEPTPGGPLSGSGPGAFERSAPASRVIAGSVSAVLVLGLALVPGHVMSAAATGGAYRGAASVTDPVPTGGLDAAQSLASPDEREDDGAGA